MSGVVPEDWNRGGSASDGDEDSSPEAVAAGAVTFITLGIGFGLLALGQPYFWIAFPVGFGGGMPLAVGLARWYESKAEASESTRRGHGETDAALADLRDRYARGELDDEEFENRVEGLLETESVADAKSFAERGTKTSEHEESAPESDPVADIAEEDSRT